MAGQQQPRRPRRPQRRTGAGGVAAAQQLLPAADIVLKLWLCIAIFKQHGVLFGSQIKQSADVLLSKGLLRRQHAGYPGRRNADDGIGQLLRQFQLVQRHDDSDVFFMGQRLQYGHQFCFAFCVQKRRRLIQQQNLRLLADGTGQQHTLALAVADLGKIPVSQRCGLHQFQCGPHLLFVGGREHTQPPGVGVAPGSSHVKAGRQLGADRVGQHQRQLAGAGIGGVGGQVLPVQQHRTALCGQLRRQRL